MSNHTAFKVVMDTLILSGMTFDQALNLVADLIREEAPLLHRKPVSPRHRKAEADPMYLQKHKPQSVNSKCH